MYLPKSLHKYAARILDYSDERPNNPISIAYVKGWQSCTDLLGHVHGDMCDNVQDALWHVRNAQPCDCEDCRAH